MLSLHDFCDLMGSQPETLIERGKIVDKAERKQETEQNNK